MKKIVVLLLIGVMFLALGCAGQEQPKAGETPPLEIMHGEILTAEREAAVREFIAAFEEMGMFSFYTMTENKDALEVWLDVGDEPITPEAVKGLTDGMIRDLAELFDGKVPVRLAALQKGEGDEVTCFGTSIYSSETKEVTYESLQ